MIEMVHDQQDKWRGWQKRAGEGLLPLLEKKGKDSTSNEKTSFASLPFKATAELLHREKTGGRKK